jgi:hypothetical protein
MSSWGCPHEHDGKCAHVNDLPCDPGMKGCVLFGRFVWADPSKNRAKKKPEANETQPPPSSLPDTNTDLSE